MVTENDFGKPVFYINGEQVDAFLKSPDKTAVGYGYEWEGEKVTHLHFSPLAHAFGKVHKVSFAKKGGVHPADATIRVDIHPDGAAFVGDVEVTTIPSRENLYKRNKGLIELDILANRRVLVIGLVVLVFSTFLPQLF